MPHQTIKLKAGVEKNETATLNEMGVSVSQLIRFSYNRDGLGLVQKLGGWSRYYPTPMAAPVRALAAWEDLNATTHLAVGAQGSPATLAVITTGNQTVITPRASSDAVAVKVTTTTGANSSTVTIRDDTTTGITSFDTVYIQTHISVGGLILFGLYPTITDDNNHYQILAVDQFGNPVGATSAVTDGGAVASFQTALNSNVVTVTLPGHGYVVGQTYPVLISTPVGGVTMLGNYVVQTVIDPNTFTVFANAQATSAASASINGGNAAYVYSYGVGAVPPASGYGKGGYASTSPPSGYGTGSAVTPQIGNVIAASDWTLDTFGQVLVACPIGNTGYNLFNPVYQFDPTSGQPTATIIPQAPPLNDGLFVAMPQRQLVCWGSTVTGVQDPLLLRWCDVSNFGQWIATPTNQAGSFRLSKGAKIVGAMQGPQFGLIWTDIDLWSQTYIGAPLVYGFNEIGTNCGLIGRKAMGALGGVVYWMGASQFYQLAGEGVSVLPCDVWDVVFQNLDTSSASRIRCAVNTRFGEIAWYYPTLTSGGEVAAYVKYNAVLGVWDYGTLARSAWIDQSVLGPPIGADPNSLLIHQHETSPDADGQPLLASFTSGYAAISEGDYKTFVDQIWPDMKWGAFGGTMSATVQITFLATDYPGDKPTTYGPFSVTQATEYVNPRLRGRLVALQVQSSDIGSFWRLGAIRYRAKVDGRY